MDNHYANSEATKPEKYQRLLPKLIEKHADAIGESKNLEGIINNWDTLKSILCVLMDPVTPVRKGGKNKSPL